jgi:general secretion pathway protein E
LGFSEVVHDRLVELLGSPQGLLFVTGPVGSGKTTTLYAALKQIAESRGGTTSLVSLEDPIEMALPFVTQTQINTPTGLTFPKVLRSVLRQDPNVLMVGEIRDRETAEIAAQAGLTGHLLLTTVHASSAAGVFPRVLDMGVEAFALASASVGCLSQRLVRTLCTACRKEAAPDHGQVARFTALGLDLPKQPFYENVGCEYCDNTGFIGRVPITELVIVDADLERAIQERRSSRELHDLAVASGTVPLLEDGLAKAAAGDTPLSEVLRAAG